MSPRVGPDTALGRRRMVAQGGRLSTPRAMRLLMLGCLALSGLLLLVGVGALEGSKHAVKTLARDTAPSIIGAQHINALLADLDANGANYLLSTSQKAQAEQAFEQRRRKLTAELLSAAENVTFGEAEKVPMAALFEGLGRYLELWGEARSRFDGGDARGGVEVYFRASDVMHATLLPAGSALDDANRLEMEARYQHARRSSFAYELLAVMSGALLVALLAISQGFLYRRTRRVLSPALAAATLLAVLFDGYLLSRFGASREDLRLAKQDAFESMHLLWQARALAYDANGDESRFLLSPSRASASEQAFRQKVGRLTTQPEPDPQTQAKLTLGRKPGFSGLFADELANVTFGGEREAASRMLSDFARYHAADGRIRALERQGKHAEAVELCVSTAPEQSNDLFARFDRSLGDVIDINQRAFDNTAAAADEALRTAEMLDPVLALTLAGLIYAGFRPRLREYAV